MEPALLKALMWHNITANSDMKCAVRTGNHKIEYNPTLCEKMSDEMFEEAMKAECIRILLKHPYERQPEGCGRAAVTMGSNCVIADNYKMKHIRLCTPNELGMISGETFEYYSKRLNGVENGVEGEGMAEQSAMWKEDAMAAAEISEIVNNIQEWGSLAGKMAGTIVASNRVRIDYRRVLQSFRSEVISSARRLTRMKPNRRSGFENLGSLYQLTTRLLVAIDVSGSTTDKMVEDFYGIINRFFRYGIEEIDVVQFDAEIHGEPVAMKKAMREKIAIEGRGGTDYQPVLDYAAANKERYQGVIIMTDGHAAEPKMPDFFRTPVLWVIPEEKDREEWMARLNRLNIVT